jgi:hypothetical protein
MVGAVAKPDVNGDGQGFSFKNSCVLYGNRRYIILKGMKVSNLQEL